MDVDIESSDGGNIEDKYGAIRKKIEVFDKIIEIKRDIYISTVPV